MRVLSFDKGNAVIEDEDLVCRIDGDVLVRYNNGVYKLLYPFSRTQPEFYQGNVELVGGPSQYKDAEWMAWKDFYKTLD